MAGWLFWLRQGERDRDADKAEGFPLGAGGFGEHRHVGGGAGEPDLVAGQRGQVLQQAADLRAGVTGLSWRGGFSSVKVSGAQAWRRCQVR